MSTLTGAERAPASEGAAPVGTGVLTAADLAELMATFNEVTAKLHATHAQLRGEVARLQGELNEANERLHRSKRLAALGEMAAGIAHEIRNPLCSIGLDADLLRQDLAEREGERRLAERIGESVHRLNAIVGDVLAFARDVRPRACVCRAGDLFDSAVTSCWAELNGLAEAVRVERTEAWDGVEVWGDPILLHQALVNLVRNGVEAMADTDPEGATLRLEASAVVEGSWAGSVLRVVDSGPGVPSEVVDRMFNPFFTTRATGTGLGLAIVHRIVDAHGGTVAVRSGEGPGGRGATVELRLPRGVAASPSRRECA